MKTNMVRNHFRALQMLMITLVMISAVALAATDDFDRIQPYSANPFYWQYKGQPVLLLGGSGQDNLFNHPTGLEPGNATLEEHLDLLKSVGGNYLRCTMSWRDPENVPPHGKNSAGIYDLNTWNPEFWNRFENFLNMTAARDIIVSIEIWDQYDYGKTTYGSAWDVNAFNPANNVNYSASASGLPTSSNDFSAAWTNPFFDTAPEHLNNTVVLPYQRAFVDKILSYTFNYRHIIYLMENECWLIDRHERTFGIGKGQGWGDYWIGYIRGKAADEGKQIITSNLVQIISGINKEQFDRAIKHWADRPEQYNLFEVSQFNVDRRMYDEQGMNYNQLQDSRRNKLMQMRQMLKDSPQIRPLNNVKIYNDAVGEHWPNVLDVSPKKFWRNLMAGCASVRFHRDSHGIGLNSMAQANIRSARMLDGAINIFATGMEPNDDLLSGRESNEAHLLAEPGKQYAIYFPTQAGDGQVTLDMSGASGQWRLRWLDVIKSEWRPDQSIQGGSSVKITKPDAGHWVAVLMMGGAASADLLGLADGPGTRERGFSIDAIRFEAESSFTADTLHARFASNSNSGFMRMAIYADNDGVPGAVLGDTAEIDFGPGRYSAALKSPVPIIAGNIYWIATWTGTSSVVHVSNNAAPDGSRFRIQPESENPYSATGDFPAGSLFSATSSSNIQYAVFATGTAPECAYDLLGDLDGNCIVDFADVALMAQNWLVCTRIDGDCP